MRRATTAALAAAILLSIVPAGVAQTVTDAPLSAQPQSAQPQSSQPQSSQPQSSQPQSDRASNTGAANTAAAIAPRLPPPPISESAPPLAFLNAAAQALAAGRTGEAQEAMERAETRALIRSVAPSLARTPNSKTLVQQIAAARDALSRGDKGEAMRLLHDAMADPDASAAAM